MDAPLTGFRVLEVANWLAAPAGCALLADFGAEVIKVEPHSLSRLPKTRLRRLTPKHDRESIGASDVPRCCVVHGSNTT